MKHQVGSGLLNSVRGIFQKKPEQRPISDPIGFVRTNTIPPAPDVATASEEVLHARANLLADGLDYILKCSKTCVEAACSVDNTTCTQIKDFRDNKLAMDYLGFCRNNFGKPECANATAYIRELESFRGKLKIAAEKRGELKSIYSLVDKLYTEYTNHYRQENILQISEGGENLGEHVKLINPGKPNNARKANINRRTRTNRVASVCMGKRNGNGSCVHSTDRANIITQPRSQTVSLPERRQTPTANVLGSSVSPKIVRMPVRGGRSGTRKSKRRS